MKKVLLVVVPFAVVFAAIAVAGIALNDGRPDEATALVTADPAHVPPDQTRVLVVTRTMPAPSMPGMTLHGQLEHGTMPQRPMHGTVLTDSECTPDDRGISRCRNDVRLADGRTIVVRHPHDMDDVPCLSPGEAVVVRPT